MRSSKNQKIKLICVKIAKQLNHRRLIRHDVHTIKTNEKKNAQNDQSANKKKNQFSNRGLRLGQTVCLPLSILSSQFRKKRREKHF